MAQTLYIILDGYTIRCTSKNKEFDNDGSICPSLALLEEVLLQNAFAKKIKIKTSAIIGYIQPCDWEEAKTNFLTAKVFKQIDQGPEDGFRKKQFMEYIAKLNIAKNDFVCVVSSHRKCHDICTEISNTYETNNIFLAMGIDYPDSSINKWQKTSKYHPIYFEPIVMTCHWFKFKGKYPSLDILKAIKGYERYRYKIAMHRIENHPGITKKDVLSYNPFQMIIRYWPLPKTDG